MGDLKLFLKGLLGGMLALLSAGLVALVTLATTTTTRQGGESVGYDPVSYIQHYVTVPSFWLKVLFGVAVSLFIFAIGFYLSIRRTISRQRGIDEEGR